MASSQQRIEPISLVAGRQPMLTLLLAAEQGSPEACHQLVRDQRVVVNERVVRQIAERADPMEDIVKVDGTPLCYVHQCRYVALHKPYRVLCSFTDPEGRATLTDYVDVPDIYAVGRLDYDSEGLLLLTDDGWLNHRLTHPEFEHPKTYWVQVERIPSEEQLAHLRQGVVIKGMMTRPAEVRFLPETQSLQIPPRSVPIRYRKNVPTVWLEIVLREGRKRQIRHMTATVDHPTLRLIRRSIGPISLGDLRPEEWRYLSDEELAELARLLESRPRNARQNVRHHTRSAKKRRRAGRR